MSDFVVISRKKAIPHHGSQIKQLTRTIPRGISPKSAIVCSVWNVLARDARGKLNGEGGTATRRTSLDAEAASRSSSNGR